MARRSGLQPLDRPAYDPRQTPVTPEANIGAPAVGDLEDDSGGGFARLHEVGRLLDTVRSEQLEEPGVSQLRDINQWIEGGGAAGGEVRWPNASWGSRQGRGELPIPGLSKLGPSETLGNAGTRRSFVPPRCAVLSVGLLACSVACGERALPPNELDLNAVRGWDYGVSFVVEVERVGSSFSWTKTFESAEPGVYRFASDLPGVTEVGDRARTLFVFADDHTHRHLVPHDGWLLLSDPSMLDALVVERVWLDGDLTCAEVSGSPGVVAVTEVCVRRVPPLVGMIERVTTSPVDGGPAYRVRVRHESVREHVVLDAALFATVPPPGSTDITTEADRRWIEAAGSR